MSAGCVVDRFDAVRCLLRLLYRYCHSVAHDEVGGRDVTVSAPSGMCVGVPLALWR